MNCKSACRFLPVPQLMIEETKKQGHPLYTAALRWLLLASTAAAPPPTHHEQVLVQLGV